MLVGPQKVTILLHAQVMPSLRFNRARSQHLHSYKGPTGEIEERVALAAISAAPFCASVPRAGVRAAGIKSKIRAESCIQSCQSERSLPPL